MNPSMNISEAVVALVELLFSGKLTQDEQEAVRYAIRALEKSEPL